MIVSFRRYELIPRDDNTQWLHVEIYESVAEDGTYNLIDTQSLPAQLDPSHPQPVSFTTEAASLPAGSGWYKIRFTDGLGNAQDTEPIFNPTSTEILASLDDINAHLDGTIIEATNDNTRLIQISVARIVRAQLTRVITQATLATWITPETTPETVREIAAMLIVAQLYFNEASRTTVELTDSNFAQRKYDAAVIMLNSIINGQIQLPATVVVEDTEFMSDLDYFPIDSTDRAFTRSMEL